MTAARSSLVLLVALVSPAVLSAHGDGLADTAARHWTWEPFTLALLIVSAAVYAAGLRVLWSRAGIGRGIRVWQAAAFGIGLLSIGVALISPVAWLSEILFSVHMTQHEILMLISAPLLVFGHPLLAALWAAPVRWREAAGQWASRPSVSSAWHALTAPVVVFVLHGVALWVWHIPYLYESALHNEGIHALEHLSYVVTAALFWWAMVEGRYGRIGSASRNAAVHENERPAGHSRPLKGAAPVACPIVIPASSDSWLLFRRAAIQIRLRYLRASVVSLSVTSVPPW